MRGHAGGVVGDVAEGVFAAFVALVDMLGSGFGDGRRGGGGGGGGGEGREKWKGSVMGRGESVRGKLPSERQRRRESASPG